MMRHLVLSVVAAGILLGVGLYHGLATDRWSDLGVDGEAVQRPLDLPLTLGDWTGERLARNDDESESKTLVQSLRFTHGPSQRWVLISLTTGRAGRVAVHNPEHCYLGSGYKVVDEIRAAALPLEPEGQAGFWTGHFQKKKATGVESIRIYWGWSPDGHWQAPTYPRLFFAGVPRLHKLYMIHPVTPNESNEDQTVYKEFMAQYVNELNRRLVP